MIITKLKRSKETTTIHKETCLSTEAKPENIIHAPEIDVNRRTG